MYSLLGANNNVNGITVVNGRTQASSGVTPDACKDASAGHIDRLNIRLPPFYPDNPAMWFVQVEGQFTAAGITSEDTKYHYVVGNLESRFADEVCDVISDPPATEKYQKLKAELIKRLGASKEQKFRRLLRREEMPEQKPSQCLRQLRSLAGESVKDDLLKLLWMSRLPKVTQYSLATQPSLSLDQLAELADALLEVPAPNFLCENEVAASADAIPVLAEKLTLLLMPKITEAITLAVRETVKASCQCVVSGNQQGTRHANVDADVISGGAVARVPTVSSASKASTVPFNMSVLSIVGNPNTGLQESLPGLQVQLHHASQPSAVGMDHAATRPASNANSERLEKIDDALSYLDQIKSTFSDQQEVYDQFLDIMKDFKNDVKVDTPAVIKRVSDLFEGHPELISGFETFIPSEYKMKEPTNEQ